MKTILMSIRPKWVAKILNGEKTVEIRKKFPKDYVGWVYIYCTKDKQLTLRNERYILINGEKYHIDSPVLNGKVVTRFWCDKVEKIHSYLEPEQWYMTSDLGGSGLLQKSCLTFKELDDYLLSGEGYAIHITKLEIFDRPKEISEFWNNGKKVKGHNGTYQYSKITRAPQSWCYVEI